MKSVGAVGGAGVIGSFCDAIAAVASREFHEVFKMFAHKQIEIDEMSHNESGAISRDISSPLSI